MSKDIKNYGRSVRDRLLTISKEEGIPYQTILTRYIQERLLYRVSQSDFKDNFFLKGGALLYAHNQLKPRPTKDLDFLGHHINNETDFIKAVFSKIASFPCPEDGVIFNTEKMEATNITEEKDYHGVRLSIPAELDSIRQNITMDVGFGDVVTPGPQLLDYPGLLNTVPPVSILAYSLETVVAEKFEAMISLSYDNSRMKDFFDLYRIFSAQTLDDTILGEAISNTFHNRGTAYVEEHPVFTGEFFNNAIKITQWKAFLRKIKNKEQLEFAEVGNLITAKLKPYWNVGINANKE